MMIYVIYTSMNAEALKIHWRLMFCVYILMMRYHNFAIFNMPVNGLEDNNKKSTE